MVLEHGFAVTAETEIRHRQKKKARVVGVMHIVARKATAFGNRRVLDRMRELSLVVTGKAEVGAGREKKFPRLCLLFVRLGMAGHAPACLDYRMEGLALEFELMANGTVRELLCIQTLSKEQNENRDTNA
jgi:hypothetical protein